MLYKYHTIDVGLDSHNKNSSTIMSTAEGKRRRSRRKGGRRLSASFMTEIVVIVVVPLLVQLWTMVDICSGLKIVMMDVPSPVTAGESVEMTCSYDLEGDRLYSVKYYKNGFEFYRYVPKDWPPAQYLGMDGIKVDVSRSDQNKVYLKNVNISSAGIYRCEISAEAPSFNTAAAEKEMQIYVLPREGPRVTSDRSEYRPGEVIKVNCTSAKSKPPATLNWFINGKSIGREHEVEYSTTLHSDGLETSSLSLRFQVSKKHFENDGDLSLKCIASVSEVYLMSNEAQLIIHNLEDRLKRPTSPQLFGHNLSQASGGVCSISNPPVKC